MIVYFNYEHTVERTDSSIYIYFSPCLWSKFRYALSNLERCMLCKHVPSHKPFLSSFHLQLLTLTLYGILSLTFMAFTYFQFLALTWIFTYSIPLIIFGYRGLITICIYYIYVSASSFWTLLVNFRIFSFNPRASFRFFLHPRYQYFTQEIYNNFIETMHDG